MSDCVASARASSLARARCEVERYYSRKIVKYGATPLGVDWGCRPSQQLRLIQLLREVDLTRKPLVLNDVGCGYGALLELLADRHAASRLDYRGYDLSEPMLEAARSRWPALPKTAFVRAPSQLRRADYCVASGIFNIRLDLPLDDWEIFVEETLSEMALASRLGFAVNFMEPVLHGAIASDPVYRPPVERWSEFVEKRTPFHVTRIDGYGLREYTLLAQRQ